MPVGEVRRCPDTEEVHEETGDPRQCYEDVVDPGAVVDTVEDRKYDLQVTVPKS